MKSPASILELATQQYLRGDVDSALKTATQVTSSFPNLPSGWIAVGAFLAEQGNQDAALSSFFRALALDPLDKNAVASIGDILTSTGAVTVAKSILNNAILVNSKSGLLNTTLANAYYKLFDFYRAYDFYKVAHQENGLTLEYIVNFFRCCDEKSDFENFEECVRIILDQGVVSNFAAEVLINSHISKKDSFDPKYIEKFRENLTGNDIRTKINRRFLKALLLERAGFYQEAWFEYRGANELVFNGKSKKAEAQQIFNTKFLEWLQTTEKSIFKTRKLDPSQPISLLILGPPRSGKTSLEHFFSKLGGVHCGSEYNLIEEAVRIVGRRASLGELSVLAELPPNLNEEFNTVYNELIRLIGDSKSVITLTNPSFLPDIPRLMTVCPNTVCIFMQRDPEENLIEIFLRRLPPENVYSGSLECISNYIRIYNRISVRLNEIFSERSIVVSYDEFIKSPRKHLKEIFAKLRLDTFYDDQSFKIEELDKPHRAVKFSGAISI